MGEKKINKTGNARIM